MSTPAHHPNGTPKTAIVTGGAGGIGAQTIRHYHTLGFNVVIADLPSTLPSAQSLISSLSDPSRAMFHATNIVDWENMQSLFRETKKRFGQVDVVVANAGMMESRGFFEFEEDEDGELREDEGSKRVVDVNVKGTMNTLRLALHAMSKNPNPSPPSTPRGSIVLIASTSGYFGGTSVVSYVASKHAVVGLARASQRVANDLNIRLNVVAPFFTPTFITAGYAERWAESGIPANTTEGVARVVVETSLDGDLKGGSVMVAGEIVREIESRRTGLMREWLGDDIADVMAKGARFFDAIGGYPLPKAREE